MRELPEIVDRITAFDPVTLERLPVRKSAVVEEFRRLLNERAARMVERLPERNGDLDPEAMDQLQIRIHLEIQRLHEEFNHGWRMGELLAAMLAAVRAGADLPMGQPLRVVDIGCGLGYVIRWLAAERQRVRARRDFLGEDVELVGVDFNPALIAEARRLAKEEALDCRFEVANAFRMRDPATVYLSTGVLHHFRGEALAQFFHGHDGPATQAFIHFEFQPSLISPLGAWLFHQARFRTRIGRHDGILSALRSYPATHLVSTARQALPEFRIGMYSTCIGPLPRPFHTLVGLRPQLEVPFRKALGGRVSRLGKLA